MLIEIDTGVFYNTAFQPDQWWQQSPECIALGNDTIENTVPVSVSLETTAGGGERMVSGIPGTWERTTVTGTFRMTVTRYWRYPAEHPAFDTKERQDRVSLEQI